MDPVKVSRVEVETFYGSHLRSHPLADLLIPEDASCRICWGSSYDDTGTLAMTERMSTGMSKPHECRRVAVDPLISPCLCSGTQKYVHKKCLDSWMKVKLERGGENVERFATCELCSAAFSVGSLDIRQEMGLRAWLRYSLISLRNKIVHSPLFSGLRWFDKASSLYSTAFACIRLLSSLPQFPNLVLTSRLDPRALKPMATNVVSSLLMELTLSTNDYRFHIDTVIFYALGWVMDASARSADRELVPLLPPSLQPLTRLLLLVPQGVGLVLQVLDLSFVYILGGISSAYLDGMVQAICIPMSICSDLTRLATQKLRMISKLLRRSIHGAASAVFLKV